MAKKHDKGLKNIGERIKYIRGSLTQPEFGKKLGVGRNNVYTWESNKSMPIAEILLQIYKEYGVNINWLLSGEGEPYIKKSKRSIVVGSRYLKMVTRLSALEKTVATLAKRKRS
jgi:transcriptional regulator with XRE-family HTH domain